MVAVLSGGVKGGVGPRVFTLHSGALVALSLPHLTIHTLPYV